MHIIQEYKSIAIKIAIVIIVLVFITIKLFSVSSPASKDSVEIASPDVESEEKVDVTIYIEIAGAVQKPGIYNFDQSDLRLFDVVESAGGFNNANLTCINQVAKVSDEQKIVIPFKYEECEAISDTGDELVNINTAELSELTSLPGIGEKKASDIISYRESSGNFSSIDDLLNVSGIGQSTIDNIKDYITV